MVYQQITVLLQMCFSTERQRLRLVQSHTEQNVCDIVDLAMESGLNEDMVSTLIDCC